MTKSKRFNFKLKRNFYKALMLLARRDYNLGLLGGRYETFNTQYEEEPNYYGNIKPLVLFNIVSEKVDFCGTYCSLKNNGLNKYASSKLNPYYDYYIKSIGNGKYFVQIGD